MHRIKIILTVILLLSSVAAAGCSSSNQDAAATAPPEETTPAATQYATLSDTGAAVSTEKTFTLEELKTYNGQDGNPAYVAVNGTVYDVTNVKTWKKGKHNGNTAGSDLTDVIGNAPHGTSVLDGLPIVGTLE